ncbi:hypothetical protein [Asanoa siamensis]|uniref:Uncharacterized protein n=1 Tax=Asanoa siamensis TaxID=926357 RepID=A0ABQ4D4D4_9ACTN|nr:hypothetical protein [Asanoa siamensis]GIF78401.1 hypothetical protein Asi02nite_79190 [Asanoa siamensis]
MTAPLRHVELSVAGNEASDLLPVLSPELLAAHGARRGLWTVLDEGPVEACVALLVQGHDGAWAAHHQGFDAGHEAGRTEDGEALAHRDGWVYVVGSHFGSKAGPLRPKRAFFARFREADAARGVVKLHVVRNQFRLHRAINDALLAADINPLPPGERVHQRFIRETQIRGAAKAKGWVDRVVAGDLPVNVEAAAFTPAGTLLLGLRFPVTQDGEPILVEIGGVEGMFDADPRSWPAVVRAYALTGVTPPGTLTGFRALTATDAGFEAVVGSIDALGKGSVLLDDHPTGGEIMCTHVRFTLGTGTRVAGEVVEDLAPFHNVEGLAVLDGEHIYVTDEDHRIALWHD